MKLFGGSKDTVNLANPPDLAMHRLTVQAENMAMQVRDFASSLQLDLIGIPGTQGFGVGVASVLPAGMTALAGTADPTSDDYGNYQFDDGSAMVYVPKFYYKYGTGSNGLAGNVCDIKGADTYATTAAANAAGYALHRAFIDGGVEQPGFFFDKYQTSKTAKGSGFVASSIKNGLPISTAADHNPIADLTAVTVNQYWPSIDAAHARDGVNGAVNASSIFHVGSMYQYAALALLSLAHGQAATSADNCAWYDAAGITNFPKGNNNNALKDANDATVIYTSDGYSNCGKTGSAGLFTKTTHNGQANGIADLNGNMWEVGLGMTCNGTTFYAAKEATRMADFTSGNSAATDNWGATGIAAMMDAINMPLEDPIVTNAQRLGNGSNQVFSEAVSGADYVLTGLALPKDTSGFSVAGTNLFGTDYYYQYFRNELFPILGGGWSNSTDAGVWARVWVYYRTHASNNVGFRCACYPE